MPLAAVCILVPIAVAVAVEQTRALDEPLGREAGCHAGTSADYVWPEADCTFAEDGSEGTILLVGDSHADSLSDVVVDVAEQLGRDVAAWTRSDVPVVGDGSAVGRPPSAAWSGAALDLAQRLDPDLVIVANRSPHYVHNPDKLSRWHTGDRPDDEAVLRAWQHEVDALLDALGDRGIPVLWVATVPEFPFEPQATPFGRDQPEQGTLSLDQVERQRGGPLQVEREAVASHAHATLFDPVPALCVATCAQFSDGVWLYRDQHHLTEDGGHRLAESLRAAMRSALEQRPLGASS